MDSLVNQLLQLGSRLFLYVPNKMRTDTAAQKVVDSIKNPDFEIVVVTLGRSEVRGEKVSVLQISQINQTFLDVLFGPDSPNRILLIEATINLGQFVLPRETGRILTFGSSFKSIQELIETARFLSGPAVQNLTITPLMMGRFLGQIGYQLMGLEMMFQSYPIQIPMRSTQYQEYLLRLEREKVLQRKEPFSALQITNLLYPPHLQQLHNLPREQRPAISPDLPVSEGGWITLEQVNLSPKINWLLQYLRLNPGRHVIYTSFNESNGVQAISTFLKLDGHQVISITGNDRQQDRYDKITQFNGPASQIILISNLYAFASLNRVQSLIMFEQHPYDTILNSYLRQIAIRSQQWNLPVLFLIAIGPNGENTIEVDNYRTLIQMINQKEIILEILRTGQIEASKLPYYRSTLNLPNLTLEELQTIFQGTQFKLISDQ